MNKFPRILTRLSLVLIACASILLLNVACNKKEMYGFVDITFSGTYNGQSFKIDSTKREIPSENIISISDVQYFISGIILTDDKGNSHTIANTRDGAHYVDMGIPSTLKWNLPGKFPVGQYTSVEFVYGFNAKDNISGTFVNPPESLMFWPEALGGGYHYMKINGKWKNPTSDTLHSFGLHTGIGQSYDNGIVKELHHNYVVIKKDSLDFFITAEGVSTLNINMEISNWFKEPHIWDFNTYGGAIMQNQNAQQILKENAWNVFDISVTL